MEDLAIAFVAESRRFLAEYMSKIARCLDGLSDAQVWWRPNDASNSIANLMLHLNGNVTQWIVGGVGERPFERHRQQEFDARPPLPRAALLERLRATVAQADEVLAALEPRSLLAFRDIQGYHGTVLAAVYHVIEHFAMHTGQIIHITKELTGADVRLWQPPPPPGPML